MSSTITPLRGLFSYHHETFEKAITHIMPTADFWNKGVYFRRKDTMGESISILKYATINDRTIVSLLFPFLISSD